MSKHGPRICRVSPTTLPLDGSVSVALQMDVSVYLIEICLTL